MNSRTNIITVTLEVEVDEHVWASTYGRGDAYDRAEAQRSRSLVADVEDYVLGQVAESAAAEEGAITGVDLINSKPAARTVVDQVLAEVREMGPVEVRQVVRGTGLSDAQVRRALRQLKDARLVESDKYMRRAAIWVATDVEPHVDNEGYEVTR